MRVIYGLSAVAAIAWVSLALAQVRDPVRPAAPARPAEAATAQAWTADQQIAATLYYGCRNEVELSKFALTKLQSNELRDFAERMITEHTEACDKLAKIAGNAVAVDARLGTVPGAASREERIERREERREERRDDALPEAAPPATTPRPAADPPRSLEIEAGGARVKVQPGARPRADIEIRGGAAGGLNWVTIHKQMADQCLATAKQEFATKERAEFDRCYLGGQIMGHLKALDEIKVLRNYASPEFRAELDTCSQGCAEHLKEAKALAKKFEGEAAAAPRVSRKPEPAPDATKPE
jgi:predicted outer membrane protein